MPQFLPHRYGRLAAFIPILLLVLLAACGTETESLTVDLAAEEGSDQSGTATLTAMDERTEVVVKVSPGPAEDDPQPLHIHFGTCGANLGNVRHVLSNVVAGESVTLVDEKLSSLRDGNSAINLHKSSDAIPIYKSCGGIPRK
jgi:hypothetical protein